MSTDLATGEAWRCQSTCGKDREMGCPRAGGILAGDRRLARGSGSLPHSLESYFEQRSDLVRKMLTRRSPKMLTIFPED